MTTENVYALVLLLSVGFFVGTPLVVLLGWFPAVLTAVAAVTGIVCWAVLDS